MSICHKPVHAAGGPIGASLGSLWRRGLSRPNPIIVPQRRAMPHNCTAHTNSVHHQQRVRRAPRAASQSCAGVEWCPTDAGHAARCASHNALHSAAPLRQSLLTKRGAIMGSLLHCCPLSTLGATPWSPGAACTSNGGTVGSSAAPPGPPRVCVVGSGPSGMYTAKELLKLNSHVHVDIFEKLPAFWGLARYGVAPDHEDTKKCINDFERIANNDRVRIVGNIEVGSRLPLELLRRSYEAVVLATGAGSEVRLTVHPNNLHGVFTAEEFVDWYNSVPCTGTRTTRPLEHHFARLTRLNSDRAVIIGQGNVALDIARLLLQSPKRIAPTDVELCFAERVRTSPLRRIDIVGRRGWVQAALTTSELRKLMEDVSDDILVVVDPREYQLSLDDTSELDLSNDNTRKRMQVLLQRAVANWHKMHEWTGNVIALRFLLSLDDNVAPHAQVADNLGSVSLRRNKLVGTPGRLRAVPADDDEVEEVIPTSLLISCTGRKINASRLLPVSVVTGTNTLKHDNGLILMPDDVDVSGEDVSSSSAAQHLSPVYAVGWLQTSGRGTIAAQILYARRLAGRIAQSLAEDGSRRADDSAYRDLECLLQKAEVMTLPMWGAVKEVEVSDGRRLGKCALKLLSYSELLSAGNSKLPHS